MSTEFFNDQWRIPSNENQNKVSNYSMELDGTNEIIRFGDVNGFDRTDAFSGSCWVNLTGSDNEFILSKQDGSTAKGYMLYVNVSRYLIFFITSNSSINKIQIRTNSTVSNNTWQHLVFTYDGSSTSAGVKLYINGVNQSLTNLGNTSITGSLLDSSVPFQISGRDGTSANGVNGKIDQVCIFDYALPATGTNSVATLYGGGTAITNPMSLSAKPIAYYQLGDQSVDNGANYLVPNNSLSDYVFNFSSDLINVANDTTIARQQNISYSLWVNTTSLTAQQYIIGNIASSNRGTGIFIINNELHFQIGNNTNDSYFDSKVSNLSTYVSANSWFHVAASWDGTDSKIYINSIERNSWTPTQPYTIAGWSAFMIGDNATISSSSYFSGKLSNVAFWNSGLTLTQAQTLYNNGAPGDISSLSPVSWYKLNAADTFDGSNWTIKDYGSGSNDGTSSGMTSANLVVSDLQQTNGFSPYALSLDGTNDQINCGNNSGFTFGNGTTDSPFSVSFWINPNSISTGTKGYFQKGTDSLFEYGILFYLNKIRFRLYGGTQISIDEAGATALVANSWNQVILTYDGTGGSTAANGMEMYINGSLITVTRSNSGSYVAMSNRGSDLFIGSRGGVGYVAAEFSNFAVFNTELTSTEVTEVYNQGVPSNLNTFSGTKPTAWWQLGSNSSFNTNWTCLNEGSVTGSNAVSANMTNDDIVNGVGYSANGLGTSSIDIKGDAPYSTANGLSENMDVLDRTTDVPS